VSLPVSLPIYANDAKRGFVNGLVRQCSACQRIEAGIGAKDKGHDSGGQTVGRKTKRPGAWLAGRV
jgi:hypothetical protein